MHNGRGGRAQFGRFACTMRAVWLLSRRRRIQKRPLVCAKYAQIRGLLSNNVKENVTFITEKQGRCGYTKASVRAQRKQPI